jgi:hypothetical protein
MSENVQPQKVLAGFPVGRQVSFWLSGFGLDVPGRPHWRLWDVPPEVTASISSEWATPSKAEVQVTINAPGDYYFVAFYEYWETKSVLQYTFPIRVTSAVLTGDLTGSDSTGSTASTQTKSLSWFQARYLARNGYQIYRAGWADRTLEYDGHLWWLTKFNAVSKVLVSRQIVTSTDFAATDFRAADYCADNVSAADLAEARKITQRFP